MKKALIIAPCAVDLAVHVAALPKSDEEIKPIRSVLRIGSFGWCAACVFEMLHLPYELIAPIGTGIYGDEVRQQAEKRSISLNIQCAEISGCTYTMIDPQGNRGMMSVPGAELTFREEYLRVVNPDEIGSVLVGGTMLAGNDRDELIEALKPYKGKILLQAGGLDKITDEICSLRPILHMSEEEVGILNNGQDAEDILDAVQKLTAKTKAPAVVLMSNGNALYTEGRQGMSTSGTIETVLDPSGAEESHAAAYLAARLSGLYPRTALAYAWQYISPILKTDEMTLPESDGEEQRKKLANAIMEKASD
ncbi:MAG: hypothetical protein EOM64_04385 [Erysipelotrichia bacterium]|nr:hypothetical protein [Erysipelotrichia bacterium]